MELVDDTKYFGVQVNQTLSWKHVASTCKKGIERNRDNLFCKDFFHSETIKSIVEASLSPILDILFQYGNVAPLPLINYESCKTEPLELSQTVGKIRLHCHLSKDLVSLSLKS